MAYLTINFCINWACYPPKGSSNLTMQVVWFISLKWIKNKFFTSIKQNQHKKYMFLTLKSSFPRPSVMCATKGRLRRSNCNKKVEMEWNEIHDTYMKSTHKSNQDESHYLQMHQLNYSFQIPTNAQSAQIWTPTQL